ncbi:hypothetical protein FS837_010584 [Tulasnella sp. UAMH 9824]|nr:hypothetical protein FS837_010584 [Tulasnella sp. UAMH 9824]
MLSFSTTIFATLSLLASTGGLVYGKPPTPTPTSSTTSSRIASTTTTQSLVAPYQQCWGISLGPFECQPPTQCYVIAQQWGGCYPPQYSPIGATLTYPATKTATTTTTPTPSA